MHRSKRSSSVFLRKSSGFTLIELLLVMVILAILAAVVVPKFTGRTEQARQTKAKTDIATLKGSLSQFEIDNGRFPTTDEGLNALVNRPGDLADHIPPVRRRRLLELRQRLPVRTGHLLRHRRLRAAVRPAGQRLLLQPRGSGESLPRQQRQRFRSLLSWPRPARRRQRRHHGITTAFDSQ